MSCLDPWISSEEGSPWVKAELVKTTLAPRESQVWHNSKCYTLNHSFTPVSLCSALCVSEKTTWMSCHPVLERTNQAKVYCCCWEFSPPTSQCPARFWLYLSLKYNPLLLCCCPVWQEWDVPEGTLHCRSPKEHLLLGSELSVGSWLFMFCLPLQFIFSW